MIQHAPVFSIMILFFGAFLTALFGAKRRGLRLGITLTTTSVSFLLLLSLIPQVFVDGQCLVYWLGGWEPVDGWAMGISLAVDGLSLFFALMIGAVLLLSAMYSCRYLERDDAQDKYYTLFQLMGGGLLGLVMSGDLFNMYVMIEIFTFAAVALVAFRNWSAAALEAGFKYLVVGAVGSGFILVGIAFVYHHLHTLNLGQITALLSGNLSPSVILSMGLIFTGFALKSFMVPFHPVAADAYMAAPTSASMVLSGVVNKAGVYGLIRLMFVVFQAMDHSAMQYLLVGLGSITMFIGVTMALAQHDFKRLLAFHSISQIGYVLVAIGLTSVLGMTGGLYHALNHTVFKGLLFLCSGAVLYAVGTTDLDRLGGLAKKMPQTAVIFLIGAFSISGIPPFNGFVSKWLIYQSTFEYAAETNSIFYAAVTVIALLVSVMTLASFIKITQSVFFGQLPDNCRAVKEVPLSMRIPMWIMAGLCLILGLLPKVVTDYLIAPAVMAVQNLGGYIDAAMGSGYAAEHLGEAALGSPVMDYTLAGYWDPVAWLVLFVVMMAAVALVALSGSRAAGAVRRENVVSADPKYDTFFGGEASEHSHVGGSDLFWGMRHNLRSYFKVLDHMHNGLVNDYALWAVSACAVFVACMYIFF